MTGELQILDPSPDTDLAVLADNCVALTPLRLDRSDPESLSAPLPPIPLTPDS